MEPQSRTNVIVITLGDPEGIGPEVITKSVLNHTPGFPLVVLGSREFFSYPQIPEINSIEDIKGPGKFFFHLPIPNIHQENSSDPSFLYVKTAIEWALKGQIAALVTGPISKERWDRAGISYRGHTALLADTAKVKNHAMMFWSEGLKVVLYTVHIPLKDIFQHLQQDRIEAFIRFIDSELARLFNKKFTLLIPGINPHAGEGGIIGKEEAETIIPVMDRLRSKTDIQLEGPFPPDTIFLKAQDIPDSVVVSWYHDQGLIAFKLLHIHSGVNLTLGLPYIRTSPDHGTGFDIAGRGIANPDSMKAAISLAEELIQRR